MIHDSHPHLHHVDVDAKAVVAVGLYFGSVPRPGKSDLTRVTSAAVDLAIGFVFPYPLRPSLD
jgi:hypothetical protein